MYKDKRGNINEILNKNFKQISIYNTNYLKKKCFWGFHFQRKFQQTKYLHLMKGEILDLAINLKNLKILEKYINRN